MRLLVSVADAEEAEAAVEGGADIIDAKDPGAGPLGAVSLPALHDILRAVDGRRPVTAALGDAREEAAIRELASAFVAAGVWLVKIGFAGHSSTPRARSLLAACLDGAAHHSPARSRRPVVAVAYADAIDAGAPSVNAIVGLAVAAGAHGVLVDTFSKDGPGLRELMSSKALAAALEPARQSGLMTAIAGRLSAGDLAWAFGHGADVVGVRGAACVHGRLTRVSQPLVRLLAEEKRLTGGRATPPAFAEVRPAVGEGERKADANAISVRSASPQAALAGRGGRGPARGY